MKIKEEFWKRWLRADELEKVSLVETLTLPHDIIPKHATAVLVNSYLVDLLDCLEEHRDEA